MGANTEGGREGKRVEKVKVDIGREMFSNESGYVGLVRFTILQFPSPLLSPGLKRTHTRAKLSAAISPTHGTAEYTHTERRRRKSVQRN